MSKVQTTETHRALIAALPKHLQIPRELWASHKNYTNNILLIQGHKRFRKASADILEGIRSLDHDSFKTQSGDSPRSLLSHFRSWHTSMGSHEAYEESKLYPFLCRRWDVDTRYLKQEHQEMHEKRDLVLAAFHRYLNFENSPQQYGSDSLIAAGTLLESAMADYDSFLRLHLAEEEEFVVPMLLELSREEFQEYYDTRATELFRKMDVRDKEEGLKPRKNRR
ncbi:hypothetical protein BDR26DRAFT_894633 [Obelidium mucronatum]|nr:hypothetical protein BDR26DRAFT_894633 [Obelidium mucronatum]